MYLILKVQTYDKLTFHCHTVFLYEYLNTDVYSSWTSGHPQVLTAREMLKLETRMSN